jgi:hypothetical protein
MKSDRSDFFAFTLILVFLGMAIASAPPRRTYRSTPQPCTKHQPVSYSPVLVKINISGSYTMKDLPEVQRVGPSLVLDALNNQNPYKYKLADGVQPNMTLYVTFNNDTYGHYGASVTGYLYDGDFNFSLTANYVTTPKLFSDLAEQVNIYITRGWCRNCPSPCVIN